MVFETPFLLSTQTREILHYKANELFVFVFHYVRILDNQKVLTRPISQLILLSHIWRTRGTQTHQRTFRKSADIVHQKIQSSGLIGAKNEYGIFFSFFVCWSM